MNRTPATNRNQGVRSYLGGSAAFDAIQNAHQPRSVGPRCGEPNTGKCHFMVPLWFRSFRDLPPLAHRRAMGRPGDAWQPAALVPRRGCTCCDADFVAVDYGWSRSPKDARRSFIVAQNNSNSFKLANLRPSKMYFLAFVTITKSGPSSLLRK